MIKEGVYIWNGELVKISNATAYSFNYCYSDSNNKWSGYYVAQAGGTEPFQYLSFLTSVENLSKLEKIVYGIKI